MHKIDVDGRTKALAEIQDLKEVAYGGLVATGPSYAGIASDKGIRIRSIKGKSVQNLGGGVTPSPDNPVAIKGVDIRSIVSTGKNEIKLCALTPLEYNGISFQPVYENGELKCVKVNGTSTGQATYSLEATSQSLKGEYVVSGCPEGGGAGSYSLCIGLYSKETGAWVSESYQTGPDLAIDCTPRKTSISILVRKGITCNNLLFYPMMRRKGTSGEYEPPKQNEMKKSLTLWSLPDGTHDEYKDGKVIRRVGIKTFDGSADEVWTARSDGTGYAIVVSDALNKSTRNLVYCNRGIFEYGGNTAKGVTVLGGAKTISYFMGGEALDVLVWRSWLSQNPLVYVYPLETSTIEDVSIPILPSYHPYTTAYTDSPVDPEIEWEILTSSNNDAQIADLISRVAALESEAVNNAQN
ncbi:hypothetical protein [uncultured Dubosiella sp.]|uniref:hypothetical protein n=2 Tax=uncultured Dubosiella sp. TaxID=1937011 RepID=UPI0025B4E613|nr:hypothetical protein [uncultured Dubosiella sp.]